MKTLLFFTSPSLLPEVMRLLGRNHRLRLSHEEPHLVGHVHFIPDPEHPERKRQVEVTFVTGIDEAWEAMRHAHFDAVVVDNRVENDGARPPFDESRAGRLLERLVKVPEVEERLRPGRVVAWVSGGPGVAAECFALGKWRVADWTIRAFDEEELLRKVHRVVQRGAQRTRTALCLAGGGLEGLLYECGVLRALQDRLRTRSVLEFDMYCGISAGAFLAATMAAGLEPNEVMRAFQAQSTVLKPLGPRVLYDPYPAEYLRRLLVAYSGLAQLPRGGISGVYARLLRAFPEAVFKGDKLEAYLREALLDAGSGDSFAGMKRKLYIGATDQDRTTHVVFGEPGRTHVPVSQAVRASAGLPPFYPPREVDGRWYVDGGVTRTTNVSYAIEQGADLVIVIDPLIPVDSGDDAGYVRRKGGFFGAIQAIKGMTHSRFEQAFDGILDRYPDVDVFLFKPDADCRRAMSGSPMRWTIRQEIEALAYRSAMDKIERHFDRFRAELGRFGFELR